MFKAVLFQLCGFTNADDHQPPAPAKKTAVSPAVVRSCRSVVIGAFVRSDFRDFLLEFDDSALESLPSAQKSALSGQPSRECGCFEASPHSLSPSLPLFFVSPHTGSGMISGVSFRVCCADAWDLAVSCLAALLVADTPTKSTRLASTKSMRTLDKEHALSSFCFHVMSIPLLHWRVDGKNLGRLCDDSALSRLVHPQCWCVSVWGRSSGDGGRDGEEDLGVDSDVNQQLDPTKYSRYPIAHAVLKLLASGRPLPLVLSQTKVPAEVRPLLVGPAVFVRGKVHFS